MSLTALWKSNPDQIARYAARQIVVLAGDGRLKDDTACSIELRAFLAEVSSECLDRYVSECLDEGFDSSGFVLQDVINEIGRRLEFSIVNGLYRGRRNAIGFDGIWNSEVEAQLLVEVKTTDTYNVNLDHVARYRSELIASGKLPVGSSILFVVGRQDTGSLESQIRGSPHAWTMRVIGAASLLKLLRIKEKSDSTTVASRIRSILRPVEYTRIDGIVDLMFDATSDVEVSQAEQEALMQTDHGGSEKNNFPTVMTDVEAMRAAVARRLSIYFGSALIRRRRSLYTNSNGGIRVAIGVSKRHGRNARAYWYAYYPSQHEYLTGAAKSFYVLAALDLATIYVVPKEFIADRLSLFSTTTRNGTTYWHIEARLLADDYRLKIGSNEFSLKDFGVTM